MSISAKFAGAFEPPYFAVIFSAQRSATGESEYSKTAEAMVELAAAQPGFLGIESLRDADGFGITVSYWESEEAIAAWKSNADHLAAQRMGRLEWYEHFELRIARVERAYAGPLAVTGTSP